MRRPLVYNNNYDRYYQPRASFGLGPRVRGPASGMIPDENARTYERNDYNNDRVAVSPRIDSDVVEHKTHATRILNSPKQPPRHRKLYSTEMFFLYFISIMNVFAHKYKQPVFFLAEEIIMHD